MSRPEQIVCIAPNVSVRVISAAHVAFRADELSALRTSTATTFTAILSPSIIKQCDELTLAALAAMQAARANEVSTPDWGIVACPRNPGRRRLREVLPKFGRDGAWSVTPHFIPHCLLHSLPGIVGQAFGLHGPSMGVGGVVDSEDQVLFTAAAWLVGGDVPGVWICATKWLDEQALDDSSSIVATVAAVVHSAEVGKSGNAWATIEHLAEATR